MPPVSAPSSASAAPGVRMAVAGSPAPSPGAARYACAAASARAGTAQCRGGAGQVGKPESRSGWPPASAWSTVARSSAARHIATSLASALP